MNRLSERQLLYLVDGCRSENMEEIERNCFIKSILNASIILEREVVIDRLINGGYPIEDTTIYDNIDSCTIYLAVLYNNRTLIEQFLNDQEGERLSFIHDDILIKCIKLGIRLFRNKIVLDFIGRLKCRIESELKGLLDFSKKCLNMEICSFIRFYLEGEMMKNVVYEPPNFVLERIKIEEHRNKEKYSKHDDIMDIFYDKLIYNDESGNLFIDIADLSDALNKGGKKDCIGNIIYILTKLILKDYGLFCNVLEYNSNNSREMEIETSDGN